MACSERVVERVVSNLFEPNKHNDSCICELVKAFNSIVIEGTEPGMRTNTKIKLLYTHEMM